MTKSELKDIIKECYIEIKNDNMSITESKNNNSKIKSTITKILGSRKYITDYNESSEDFTDKNTSSHNIKGIQLRYFCVDYNEFCEIVLNRDIDEELDSKKYKSVWDIIDSISKDLTREINKIKAEINSKIDLNVNIKQIDGDNDVAEFLIYTKNISINEGYKEDYKPGIFGGELKRCVVQDENDILNTDLKRIITKIWNTEARKKIMNVIDTDVLEWYNDDIKDENGETDESLFKKKVKEIQKLALELLDLICITQFDNCIKVEFWINNYHNSSKSKDFFQGHSMSIEYSIVGDKFNFRYGPTLEG